MSELRTTVYELVDAKGNPANVLGEPVGIAALEVEWARATAYYPNARDAWRTIQERADTAVCAARRKMQAAIKDFESAQQSFADAVEVRANAGAQIESLSRGGR